MKLRGAFCAQIVLLAVFALAVPLSGSRAATVRPAASFGRLPLFFEANRGQTDARVRFLARGGGYSLFLTPREAVLALRRKGGSSVLRMRLIGSSPSSPMSGLAKLAGEINYFVGSDPKRWRANVPTFARVRCTGVYPGIDLIYYGSQRQLEYDFVVAPGADPRTISLAFPGAAGLQIDARGDLVVKTGGGAALRCLRPVAYQSVGGARRPVAARYALLENRTIGFRLGRYDTSRSLVIDPIVSYSTYIGGDSYEGGYGIAVDAAGNAYVTGYTGSTNFPLVNPLQTAQKGNGEGFVAKLNPAGSALVYATYLGGSSYDVPGSIAVDDQGSAYVIGWTLSDDFPVKNALQGVKRGDRDVFVTKLNPSGSALVYSTFLGGQYLDEGYGIALDTARNVYVTGRTWSRDFPTRNPIQSPDGSDAFVAKIDSGGTALVYSTFLGGNGSDEGTSIAVDSTGSAYVTGWTFASDFPTVNAFQPANPVSPYYPEAFVTKLSPSGSALMYSTYLVGNGEDRAQGVAVDGSGNAYVTGFTSSTDFPVKNAVQSTNKGTINAFVARIDTTKAGSNSLLYATYLGGSQQDKGFAIAADAQGNAWVTGHAGSPDFPTMVPLESTFGGPNEVYGDAFLAKLGASGSLVYSTFLGGTSTDVARGITLDTSGNAYVVGDTNSADFPATHAAPPPFADAFVVKFADVTDGQRPGLSGAQAAPSVVPSSGGAVTLSASAADERGVLWVRAEAIGPDGERRAVSLARVGGTVTQGSWQASLALPANFDPWEKTHRVVFSVKDVGGNLTQTAVPIRVGVVGPQSVRLEFTRVSTFGSWPGTVEGRAYNVDPSAYKVAVLIYVPGHGWWSKPYCDAVFTTIQPDGRWSAPITTGGSDSQATIVAAYLVPAAFSYYCVQGEGSVPTAIQEQAVARAITTRLNTSERLIRFSGYVWRVKSAFAGPGPNSFSDRPENVSVDDQGRLHLRITKRDNFWYCPEIFSVQTPGYGHYRFFLDSPVDALDPRVVLGLFTWSDDPAYGHREIDFEAGFKQTNDPTNAQFVVQPYTTPGNLLRFTLPAGKSATTQSFRWLPDGIFFQSLIGHHAVPPDAASIVRQWTYAQPGGVPPTGDEKVHANLWLLGGQAPQNGLEAEVILNRFEMSPAPLFALTYANRWFFLTAHPGEQDAAISAGWWPLGAIGRVYTQQSDAPGLVPIYRLSNRFSGDHLYTLSAAESTGAGSFGYVLEGIAGYAFAAPGEGRKPLYRAVHAGSGQHRYLGDRGEYDALPQPWIREGIAAYVLPALPTPLYRLDHPVNGSLLTTSSAEHDYLARSGWKSHLAGLIYVSREDAAGLVPLHRLNNGNEHFFTADAGEAAAAMLFGYWYEGIAGYVFPGPGPGRTPLYRLNNPGSGRHLYSGDFPEYTTLPGFWLREGVAAYLPM